MRGDPRRYWQPIYVVVDENGRDPTWVVETEDRDPEDMVAVGEEIIATVPTMRPFSYLWEVREGTAQRAYAMHVGVAP